MIVYIEPKHNEPRVYAVRGALLFVVVVVDYRRGFVLARSLDFAVLVGTSGLGVLCLLLVLLFLVVVVVFFLGSGVILAIAYLVLFFLVVILLLFFFLLLGLGGALGLLLWRYELLEGREVHAVMKKTYEALRPSRLRNQSWSLRIRRIWGRSVSLGARVACARVAPFEQKQPKKQCEVCRHENARGDDSFGRCRGEHGRDWAARGCDCAGPLSVCAATTQLENADQKQPFEQRRACLSMQTKPQAGDVVRRVMTSRERLLTLPRRRSRRWGGQRAPRRRSSSSWSSCWRARRQNEGSRELASS